MKKIILLAIVAISFSITGCSDFLDTENLTKKDSSNYPQTEEDARELLNGAYSALYICTNPSHPFLAGNILSDDCLAGGGLGDLSQPIRYLKAMSENDFGPLWSALYTGIYRCNNILENAENVQWENGVEKNKILGETYYLRGMFYYYMAITFGNVPLVLDTTPQNNPKASADEMFKVILSDLKQAIELLPNIKFQDIDKNKIGYATKWAAEALMARAYLFYDGYYKQNRRENVTLDNGSVTSQNVIAWLEDCIKNSGHDLLSDFRNQWPYAIDIPEADYKYARDNNLLWVGESGDNNETIFAVKYSSIASWSDNYSNPIALNIGLRGQTQVPFGMGWGICTVSTNFWNEWPDEDLRKKGSILDVRDTEEGLSGYDFGVWEAWQETGYLPKKYLPVNVKKVNADGSVTICNYSCVLYGTSPHYMKDTTQDLVLIRFADVLLMHAEMTRTIDGINRVRTRAQLPPILAYTDEALRSERRYELAFEALRYHDLLRWYGTDAGTIIKQNLNHCIIYNNLQQTTINEDRGNGYFDQFDKRVKETGGFMQIPNDQIQLSNGVLEQNPGWEGSNNMF